MYDDRKRGKILYNVSGLKNVSSNSFFMKDDPDESNVASSSMKGSESKPINIYDS